MSVHINNKPVLINTMLLKVRKIIFVWMSGGLVWPAEKSLYPSQNSAYNYLVKSFNIDPSPVNICIDNQVIFRIVELNKSHKLRDRREILRFFCCFPSGKTVPVPPKWTKIGGQGVITPKMSETSLFMTQYISNV